MTVERWCPIHSAPLIELACAYPHGLKWDNATRKRVPCYEVETWLHVEDGIVVAEVDKDRVRWLREKFDGRRRLAGRNPDGTGGRPWGLDMGRP